MTIRSGPNQAQRRRVERFLKDAGESRRFLFHELRLELHLEHGVLQQCLRTLEHAGLVRKRYTYSAKQGRLLADYSYHSTGASRRDALTLLRLVPWLNTTPPEQLPGAPGSIFRPLGPCEYDEPEIAA